MPTFWRHFQGVKVYLDHEKHKQRNVKGNGSKHGQQQVKANIFSVPRIDDWDL